MRTTQDIAGQLLDCATANHVAADCIISSEDSFSIKAHKGALDEHKVSATRVIGLRVVSEGKTGTASSEADDAASLDQLFNQACQNARYATTNEHERIQELSHQLQSDDDLLCPEEDLKPAQRIEELLQFEADLLQQDHINSIPYNGSSCRVVEQQIFSTAGLAASSRRRVNSIFAYALAKRDDQNAMSGSGQIGRRHSDFDLPSLVTTISSEAQAMLAGKPIETGHYDIIFDPEMQNDLFAAFGLCLSAKAACDGVNPWREQVSKQVASPLLHLSDRPTLSDGMGHALFDAEGTVCQDVDIITAGTLQTLLHNSATAAELGTTNTANATRSARSPLGVSSHQLVLAPGTSSDADLRAGQYVELTKLQGLHSGANAITGDFSLGAAGYLCQDGQRQQALRGITVAGNFYQMLQDVLAVGDQQHWNWQKSSLMPALRFGGLTVSG